MNALPLHHTHDSCILSPNGMFVIACHPKKTSGCSGSDAHREPDTPAEPEIYPATETSRQRQRFRIQSKTPDPKRTTRYRRMRTADRARREERTDRRRNTSANGRKTATDGITPQRRATSTRTGHHLLERPEDAVDGADRYFAAHACDVAVCVNACAAACSRRWGVERFLPFHSVVPRLRGITPVVEKMPIVIMIVPRSRLGEVFC